MIEEIIAYLIQNPIAMKIVVVMIACRAIFKPLCIGIQAYVDSSESEKDNELWAKIKENKIFKGFEFILDYAFSIKLPKA